MTTIDAYVAAVRDHLPRWHPARREVLADLRAHLSDRIEAGENEAAAVRDMEDPGSYAAKLMEGLRLKPAPFGRRVLAFLIDLVVGTPLAFVTMYGFLGLLGFAMTGDAGALRAPLLDLVVGMLSMDPTVVAVAVAFGFTGTTALVLSVVYFPIIEATRGTTVGKWAMGLSVVKEDGTRIDWGKAIVRRLPFYLEIFWIDAFFALFGRRRQRAFDHVAGTWVVRCPE